MRPPSSLRRTVSRSRLRRQPAARVRRTGHTPVRWLRGVLCGGPSGDREGDGDAGRGRRGSGRVGSGRVGSGRVGAGRGGSNRDRAPPLAGWVTEEEHARRLGRSGGSAGRRLHRPRGEQRALAPLRLGLDQRLRPTQTMFGSQSYLSAGDASHSNGQRIRIDGGRPCNQVTKLHSYTR